MHILPVHPIQQSQGLFISGTGFPEPAGIAVHLSHGIQRKGIAEGVGKRAGFGVHLVALGNSHTDFSTEKGGFYKYSFQFEIGVIALGFIQLGQKAVGIQRVTLLPGQIVETEAVVKSGDDLMDYTFLFFSPRIRFICCRCNYCAPEPNKEKEYIQLLYRYFQYQTDQTDYTNRKYLYLELQHLYQCPQ